MSEERKYLLWLVLILVAGFTVINTLSVMALKISLENELYVTANALRRALITDRTVLPYPFKISERPEEGFIPVVYRDGFFILVDENYIPERLKSFATVLVLWEGVFILFILLLFRRTVLLYIKREKDIRYLLNLLLLALTHRLGNFLSVVKLNLELMEDSKPKERIISSTEKLEEDYKKAVEVLESLSKGYGLGSRIVNVKEVVEELLKGSDHRQDIRLMVKLEDTLVRANPIYLEILVGSVIENSLKYAISFVHIKLCGGLLVVRNDFGSVKEGSGMGLKIARFAAQILGFDLRIKYRNRFTVFVNFKS